MPHFHVAERERGMKPKRVILANLTQKGAKTGVLSDQTGNISKNMAFLQRYESRPKTILGQRMAKMTFLSFIPLSRSAMQKCGILFTNHYGFAAPHGKRLFITVIIDKNAFAQLSNAEGSD